MVCNVCLRAALIGFMAQTPFIPHSDSLTLGPKTRLLAVTAD